MNMGQKEDFRQALIEYLHTAEMIELRQELKLRHSDDYHHLCSRKTYYRNGDQIPYRVVVPNSSYMDFLKKINNIFESKVNQKLIDQTVGKLVCELTEFPFTQSNLDEWAEIILEEFWTQYQIRAEALVPLYNIMIEGSHSIPVANSILCSGGEQTIFAVKAKKSQITKYIDDVSLDKCFLRIPVSGDSESILRQVENEAKKALTVLRFVNMWSSRLEGTTYIKYNQASRVTTHEQKRWYIMYYKPEESDGKIGFHSRSSSLFYFTKNRIDNSYSAYGLENLNYHFANSANPVSRRIIRALELYDSGTQSLTNYQALYRYVVSINVVLPMSGSRGKELVKHLTNLIQYGGTYVGSMKNDTDNMDDTDTIPDEQTWDEIVERTAKPFEDFYTLRNKILHGNTPSEEISSEGTEECRVLAHNAIRLMAFVAREFNWQTDREAIRWFESPTLARSL